MARCKDCIHYDVCKYRPLAIGVDICDAFRNTADVVPKSEVEKLSIELLHAKEDYGDLFATLIRAKSEVAREIFEEIETALKLYKQYDLKSGTYFECYLEADIAELKKKYTKEAQ